MSEGQAKPPWWGLLRPSMGLYRGRRKWLIYGRKKVGKTFWALSASRKFPGTLPAEQMVELDDIAYIAVDENALSGADEVGICVPYTFDLTWAVTEPKKGEKKPVAKNYRVALTWAVAAVRAAVIQRGANVVVVDTVSTLAKKLFEHYSAPERAVRSERTGNVDTFAVYGQILKDLTSLLSELSKLPANVIFLCHSQVNEVQWDDSRRAASKREESDLPGGNMVVPEIIGKSLGNYEGNVDVIAVADAIDKGQGKLDRVLKPYGDATWRGGTRYTRTLSSVERDPMHKILARIEASPSKYLTKNK